MPRQIDWVGTMHRNAGPMLGGAMQAFEQVLATQRSVSFLEPPPYTCRGNDVAIPFPSHDMCCEEAGTPVPEVSRHVRLPTVGLARFEHPQSSNIWKLLFLQRMCIPATPLQCPTSTLTLTSTSMTTHGAHPASSTTCRGPRRSPTDADGQCRSHRFCWLPRPHL